MFFREMIIAAALTISIPGETRGGAEADVVSAAYARGVVVLRIIVPNHGAVKSFSLKVSTDGEVFEEAKASPARGGRFSHALVEGADSLDQVVLLAPVVGRFDLAPLGYVFPNGGRYYVRWEVAFRDPGVANVVCDQEVRLEPATKADVDFLSDIGRRTFVSEVFHADIPETVESDEIALDIVRQLLAIAQGRLETEGNAKIPVSTADAMWALAKTHAESSYAPYAAFYAGQTYKAHITKAIRASGVSRKTLEDINYQRANDALRFAARRGDVFLAPRALCALAMLRTLSASFAEAEQLLDDSKIAAKGQGVIEESVRRLRRILAKHKENQD